ncbi:MAG: MPT63 family protein, partial [Mycobacterium sp.]|nr:MPT63 family protein [Mycobacterium sp.]
MKITKITTTAIAAIGAFGVLGAPLAAADANEATVTMTSAGQQAKLVDGNNVQGWTITGLKPSTDVIDYAPNGTLWEATATDEAIQGPVTPIVSNFNARAANGQNYRVLFGVASPQGVNPATLPQGQKTTGKVYFDVTGPAPQCVVYNAGGQDLIMWRQGAEATATGAAPAQTPAHAAAPVTAGAPAAAPTAAPAATPAAAPAGLGSAVPAGTATGTVP